MLKQGLTTLQGIGERKAAVLREEAGLETIEDLLYYMPRRYVDRSSFKLIKDCFVNETVTVSGIIRDVRMVHRKRRFLEVDIDDGSDSLTGVFFGGASYFQKIFLLDETVIFSGKINFFKSKQIVHPDFDFIDTTSTLSSINTGRIIPLYRSTEALKRAGFDSRGFRRIIRTAIDTALDSVREVLDPLIPAMLSLPGLKEAILAIHFPDSLPLAEAARRRLAFNEIFFLQYYLALIKRFDHEKSTKKGRPVDPALYTQFRENLPFTLTRDQETAIVEIREDIASPHPMNRMLQGDVGAGKTVVALAAALFTVSLEMQAAFMAPTEVLAFQHYRTISGYCSGMGVSIGLLTGSISAGEKKAVYSALKKGEIDILIGTHALIQAGVNFKELGLIIIDEQHRFGVRQRSLLREKGREADLLVMTATPIPRSLSLTLYGDLDLSILKEGPANRLSVQTVHLPGSRRRGVYNSIRKYVTQGRQVYYILPLIDESEKIDLKSAVETYNTLSKDIFPDLRVAIIHGRMKQDEKDGIMTGFQKGEIDILVSTTVIEVGIDVANAGVIVIEHPERFGLSQLHQLRGRVGRGKHQSYCVLISGEDISEQSRERIEVLITTTDGFIIAEEDLKQRGAGELVGYRQSGREGSFEFLNLSMDLDLINAARSEAQKQVAKLPSAADALDQINSDTYTALFEGIRKKRILSILS